MKTVTHLLDEYTGLMVVVILSVGTDGVLRASGVFPAAGNQMGNWFFLLAMAYRTLYSVAGSYIAARLAPDRPLTHALALGGVGFVLCVAGTVTTWNRGAEFGPKWYPLALVALAIPGAWVGGMIRILQLRARPRLTATTDPEASGG